MGGGHLSTRRGADLVAEWQGFLLRALGLAARPEPCRASLVPLRSSTLHAMPATAPLPSAARDEHRRERRWWIVLGAFVGAPARDPARHARVLRPRAAGVACLPLPAAQRRLVRVLRRDAGVHRVDRPGRQAAPRSSRSCSSSPRSSSPFGSGAVGSPTRRVVAVLLPAAAVSLALTLPIHQMQPPGAAVFGWPLLWAIPMIPIRAAGLGPSPDTAFVVGFVLTLVALAVAVVATAYVGRYATGRRSVGLVAAGLFAVWPLVSGQIVSTRRGRTGSGTSTSGSTSTPSRSRRRSSSPRWRCCSARPRSSWGAPAPGSRSATRRRSS